MVQSSGAFAFGRFVVRADTRQVLVDGVPAKLGARAFDLLATLIERRERVVSKDELLELVWPRVIVEENNLQVHISALRKLLGPQAIGTIPGRGYRFTAQLESEPRGLPETDAAAPDRLPQGNLPEALPVLYGREQDLKVLLALLQAHRLITLVGASGIGKTRLAQAVAHSVRDQWPDGVWMVELAPVIDPELVPAAAAQALGARLSGQHGGSAELSLLLRGKVLLLVLDNCEHLLQGTTALVAAVLAQAPDVKVLVTSQEPLHAADEQQFRVQSLAVPSEVQSTKAQNFGALALFEARARAVDPRFGLDERNLAAVVEICRRLDGLPLAIELAAARVPLLGVEGVRNRLDDRFRVLTAGARTALPRHQTLRAAIEWSYALLDAHEQAVMRRLGVFVGGFGLEGAQHVAADENIDEWAVLDHLGALVDKSLVVAEPGEEPRYRLLETGRTWAIEKLAEAGEMEATLRRHAQAVLAVFERSDAQQWILPISARVQRYLPEIDNLRAALEWVRGPMGDADLHVGLMGVAAWILRSIGLRLDVLRRCEEAMARITPTTPPIAEARLLSAWLRQAFPRIGAPECAAGARAVELYRAHGDTRQLMAALTEYGTCLAVNGAFALAERTLDEADVLYEPAWPVTLRLTAIRGRAWLRWIQGRREEASDLVEEGIALMKPLGDTYLITWGLVRLGAAKMELGRVEDAIAHGREAVALARSERFIGKIGWFAFGHLTNALTVGGRLDEALELAREILPSVARTYNVLPFLDAFGLLAFKRGHTTEAARVLGRADAQYASLSEKRRPTEGHIREILLRGLRQELPAAELERLLKEGEMLGDDEAAQLALTD